MKFISFYTNLPDLDSKGIEDGALIDNVFTFTEYLFEAWIRRRNVTYDR